MSNSRENIINYAIKRNFTEDEMSFINNLNVSIKKLNMIVGYIDYLNYKKYPSKDIVADIQDTLSLKPENMKESDFDKLLGNYLFNFSGYMYKSKRKKYLININLDNREENSIYRYLLYHNHSLYTISFIMKFIRKSIVHCKYFYSIYEYSSSENFYDLLLEMDRVKESSFLNYLCNSLNNFISDMNIDNSDCEDVLSVLYNIHSYPICNHLTFLKIFEILRRIKSNDLQYNIDYYKLLKYKHDDRCYKEFVLYISDDAYYKDIYNDIFKQIAPNTFELNKQILDVVSYNENYLEKEEKNGELIITKYGFSKDKIDNFIKISLDYKTDIHLDQTGCIVHFNIRDNLTCSLIIEFFSQNSIIDGKIEFEHKFISKKIVIFPDEGIYEENRDKFYPLSLKNFWHYKKCIPEIFNILINIYASQNLLFKDIINDCEILFSDNFPEEWEYLIPISINDIMKFHNKKEMLTTLYKTANEIKIKWNKININYAYLIIKAYPYLNDKSKNILINQKFYYCNKNDKIPNCDMFYNKRIKMRIQKFLYFIIYNQINNKIDTVYFENETLSEILNDYINMCFLTKTKIRLDIKTFNQLTKIHDKLSQEKYKTMTSKVKIPKDSCFKNLRKILPKDFEWIKSRQRLINETVMQHHCVWSYADYITKDISAIYSYFDEEGKYGKPARYTIEFRCNKSKNNKKYYIAQVQGKYNSVNTYEIKKDIQNILDEAS